MCNPRTLLDEKRRIGPVACLPLHAYALVISTETESGFIAEDHTPPVTLQLAQCRGVVGKDVAALMIARSSDGSACLGCPDFPCRQTFTFMIHCCCHRATTISLRLFLLLLIAKPNRMGKGLY
ncbi:hypothetical protein TNCV_494941 [Trichonephila clavipes]|nr:hypothetical protein TNCV_494941 [Trichonephila clavipes]